MVPGIQYSVEQWVALSMGFCRKLVLSWPWAWRCRAGLDHWSFGVGLVSEATGTSLVLGLWQKACPWGSLEGPFGTICPLGDLGAWMYRGHPVVGIHRGWWDGREPSVKLDAGVHCQIRYSLFSPSSYGGNILCTLLPGLVDRWCRWSETVLSAFFNASYLYAPSRHCHLIPGFLPLVKIFLLVDNFWNWYFCEGKTTRKYYFVALLTLSLELRFYNCVLFLLHYCISFKI
jgi:hypothetical protein